MLELMRIFNQVIEENSFTLVARKLGISQPAISNQIRAFEEKLGVKLFVRKGKGFALTPEGETVHRHAKHMLEEWHELQQEIGGSELLMDGKVHLGASHIPGEYLLPKHLAALREPFPKIKFKLSIGDSLQIAEKVLSHEVDFAIVGAVFDTDKLYSKFWLKDQLELVISQDHPLNTTGAIELETLKQYPMVVRESGSGHRRAFEEVLGKKGIDLDDFSVALEAGSTEAVKNAVRSGMGYSFLSRHALESCECQGLVCKKIEDFSIERDFYLLTRRNKPLNVLADECYRYFETVYLT